jgi:hypothetical protein
LINTNTKEGYANTLDLGTRKHQDVKTCSCAVSMLCGSGSNQRKQQPPHLLQQLKSRSRG